MPLNNPSISSILSHLVHVDPKMNKPNYYHHYTIFILSVLIHLSVCHSSSSLYNTCFSKTCGDVSISYPFHIAGEQKTYCGYPGFEVTCQNESNPGPYLNISGYNYLIKKIWYENQTFEVVNSVFLNTKKEDQCADSVRNLTFVNGLFEFATNHSDLLLLIKCPENNLSEYRQFEVNCRALAVGENDPGFGDLRSDCDRVVAVPYEDDVRVINGNFEEVLTRGVVLNWMGTENCSDCAKSGGQCGFDQTLSKFQCYCSDRPHSHQCHKGSKLGLALGLGISSGAVIVLIVIAILWYRKRLKPVWKRSVSRKASLDRSTSDVEKGTIYFGVPVFSYAELKEATHSFHDSKELGDGGFGIVYYGKLKDGREVAVKRLYEKSCKRVEQFMNEVRILTCLKHQNLVSLYGCTSTNSNELLLVYEYVPNGTVADHLYGDKANNSPGGFLPWHFRLNIAVETASALAYLHASDIVHRDVKTNNILLDNNFNVKVADFGLSRLFPNDVTHVSTAPQGTPGYLDPEYHQCYQLTDKSDVYSFGVVLVELISSLPAVDMDRHRHEINLSNYAMTRIQRCAFDELVDQQLGFESDSKVRRMTTAVAELAFQCLQHDKEFRPSMDEVLETLRRIQSSNYDQEEDKNDGGSVVVEHANIPPPSPNSEKDDIKLLTRHSHGGQHVPPSPDSVMDKWGSRLTTPSSSK